MADNELTPQDSSSDAMLTAESAYQPNPTGLLEAAYTCPKCGAVVVRITGNSMEFLYSHIREKSNKPNEQGYVSLVFCHTTIGEGDMFYPPREYIPRPDPGQPYLNVQSTMMASHPLE